MLGLALFTKQPYHLLQTREHAAHPHPRRVVHVREEPLAAHLHEVPAGRGLHSSTFRLNVSAFCGVGGAFRGCSGGVYEVLRGSRRCLGCAIVP